MSASSDHDIFAVKGEIADLMRAKDWSATSLGPVRTWPHSLRTVVRVLLSSRFAMWMGWGPELTCLYNDAYAAMTLGAKHPWALGRPAREVWAEIWPEIGPRIERVLRTGESTWDEDLLLFLERSGYQEETYHTFSYSPVTDDHGDVCGNLCVVTEETDRVIGERRMALLRDAAAAIAATMTEAELFGAVERALDGAKDLPFTLTYLLDESGQGARLVCRTGIPADHPGAPASIAIEANGHGDRGAGANAAASANAAAGATPGTIPSTMPWPLAEALASGVSVLVSLADREWFANLPAGPWPRPATHALVLPMLQSGQRRVGVIVAGLNPFRQLDEAYRSFIGLFVGQLSAGVLNAHALAEERRRAEALAEIDRAKTTFFNNVSHEFRTPLTLLIGPLEEARRALDGENDGVPPQLADQLTLAHRNSLRLLKLVNTLLDFSRIEAGRSRAHYEPIDLCTFTIDLASTFRSAMDAAGLRFTVDCEPDPALPDVHVDREMWEKIVLNLVSNAFKFTLHGGITVSLSLHDSRAVLAVRDTGVGIPREELPRVFERFHRVEGTQGRSHEGSGIGLSLVHELVKLHGGELSVESEPGQGSEFRVSIPLGSAHLPAEHVVTRGAAPHATNARPYIEEALRWLPSSAISEGNASAAIVSSSASSDSSSGVSPDSVASSGASSKGASSSGGSTNGAATNGASADAGASSPDPSLEIGRVLLADDNADMRDYAARLLSQRWHVDTVGNGQAALQSAREQRPDVIVTDVMMPGLDGFGLLRALRADPELQAIPVIMLSARAGEEARLEGLAASADDYLVKPFSAHDLLVRVEAQLVKARARTIEQRHARRMTSLFSHAPVAIAVLRGPEHVYELSNARYQALVGDRDIVGKPIRQALPEVVDQGIVELLDQVRETGQPYIGRSLRVDLVRTPNGPREECWFDFVYQPVFDADGHVDTIVVIAHDVTALASAMREAETANRVKDEFLATLSHEMRTPLNAVLGYTQMLRGGVIDAHRFGSVLETIERNAKLQEKLISDVLDVSRIITGKLRIDIRPVDLSRVVREAMETVTPTAAAKGIRIQSAIDHPGVPVAGDGARLQQVLWNLLSNAIKFTPKGGRVQVRLERVNSHVEITVSDTGEGIAPEFLPHLFQRFSQADNAFTRTHGGLGLGLAISRHLVEAHGGRINASSPGKGLGTTVRVELPLMIVHDDRLDARNRIHPTLDLPSTIELRLADLAGLHVLLVDDDRDALSMAKDALTVAGANVTAVLSARDALDALDHGRFDAAVLDIGLPDTDGYELLRQIRARPPESQGTIPVAALTAYARTADRTRSLQAGFQMHLSKPIEPGELAAAVYALARRPRI